MTRQYNTRCWFCDSTDLEPHLDGIHCRSCGATYCHIPKPGQSPVSEHRDFAAAPKGRGSLKSPSPSGTVKRRAAKAHK